MKSSAAEFGKRITLARGTEIQTKFLRLRSPVCLEIGLKVGACAGWGGWDKGRIFFVVMVERTCRPARAQP